MYIVFFVALVSFHNFLTQQPSSASSTQEVKLFIKGKGHADAYDGLKITFIAGRTPELFLFDETGKEIDKIDLSRMKTGQLHELMKTKGFTRSSPIPQGSVEMKKIRRTDQERFLRRPHVPHIHHI